MYQLNLPYVVAIAKHMHRLMARYLQDEESSFSHSYISSKCRDAFRDIYEAVLWCWGNAQGDEGPLRIDQL